MILTIGVDTFSVNIDETVSGFNQHNAGVFAELAYLKDFNLISVGTQTAIITQDGTNVFSVNLTNGPEDATHVKLIALTVRATANNNTVTLIASNINIATADLNAGEWAVLRDNAFTVYSATGLPKVAA